MHVVCLVEDVLDFVLESSRAHLTFTYLSSGPIASMFWLDEALCSDLYLDGIITVVDSKFCLKQINKNAHDAPTQREFSNQIALADVIIMNKVDLVDKETLQKCKACVRSMNSSASLIETSHGKVSLDAILDLHAYDTGHFHFDNENNVNGNHGNSGTHLNESISTHTFEFKGTFNELSFECALEKLLWTSEEEIGNERPQVLRLKGIVNFTEQPNISYQLQAVYDMFDKYKLPNRERTSKIIVIGQHLCKRTINQLFSDILVT